MSSAARIAPQVRAVSAGTLTLGPGPVTVVGGAPGGEPDARWITLRDDLAGRTAAQVLAGAREGWAGPLLVELMYWL